MKAIQILLLLTVTGVFSACVSGGGKRIDNPKNYKPDLSKGASNFYDSDTVDSKRVSFKNQYNMTVVGNLYKPKGFQPGKKYEALVVGHPMGAVKEQSANLYATKMAERGYVTVAIDLTYWGESEGEPRNSVSPDMYAESFSAAVDFLGTRDYVNRKQIGVIGICGSGGFAVSAAKMDSRLKAIATVSMYDMGDVNRNALNSSLSLEDRRAIIEKASQQRYKEFLGEERKYTGGTVLEYEDATNPIAKEFFDFYRTRRGGYIPEGASFETITKPTLTSNMKFMSFYPFEGLEVISPRPMLFITGDQAHSKEFSEKAFKKASEPKELYYVKGAGHVDLYDRVEMIPFEKLDDFFKENLN